MPRRPPGELRLAILEATVALLGERQDPALVSVEAVVSTVGCSPPALYYYFPTKNDLLWQACRDQYQALVDDLAATPHSDDPLTDLCGRGWAHLEWARSYPASYRILFMTPLVLTLPSGPSAEEGAGPDPRKVPGLDGLVAALERAAAAGHPVGDPDVAAFALRGVVHGFASMSITEPGIPAELLRAGLDRAFLGLLPR